MDAPRAKVSAFVISFNRATIIGTCLRALRFADEVIVVDKSSTDDTPAIAARHADRVVSVPWSETVEETRAFAASLCTHDWIIFLDDDECLSAEAARFVEAELRAPRADIYELPRRDYILGVHDEHAYYWPEHHVRLFRRGAVAFTDTVHAGLTLRSDRVLRVDAANGVCIHHLSHQDVAQWIEKANRYTSRPDRVRPDDPGQDLLAFAHRRIEHWIGRTRDVTPGGYPTAVALLRACYDLIDRLKVWEEERGLDGAASFAHVCAAVDAEHGDAMPDRAGERSSAVPVIKLRGGEASILRASIATLRARHDAAVQEMREREDRLMRDLEETRASRHAEHVRAETAEAAQAATAAALHAIEGSTFWRATAWPRRVATRLRMRR